jgi:sugar/nucleoside kinase (ribokinase family)
MGDIKATVAGHICIDITPIFPQGTESRHESSGPASGLILPGSLTRVEGADIHTGGAVANTGLAMRKFGIDATLMGKLGRDAFGAMILDILRGFGADGGMRVIDGETTSYSVVIAAPGHDRAFLHCPGANDSFTAADLDFDSIARTRLFHFGYPPIMASLYRDGGTELSGIFRRVSEGLTLTSLDMAAVQAGSESSRADWPGILAKTLPFVDFFEPSYEELAQMLSPGAPRALESLSIENDVAPLARKAISLGAKAVMLKCGARGFYYEIASGEALDGLGRKGLGDVGAWRGKRGFEPSYIPARVLSATGAGDTTIAAFLSGILLGHPLERCVHLASAAGASCVEAYDALGGLKSLEELGAKIDAGWAKRSEKC